jgi:hypothetical protein
MTESGFVKININDKVYLILSARKKLDKNMLQVLEADIFVIIISSHSVIGHSLLMLLLLEMSAGAWCEYCCWGERVSLNGACTIHTLSRYPQLTL